MNNWDIIMYWDIYIKHLKIYISLSTNELNGAISESYIESPLQSMHRKQTAPFSWTGGICEAHKTQAVASPGKNATLHSTLDCFFLPRWGWTLFFQQFAGVSTCKVVNHHLALRYTRWPAFLVTKTTPWTQFHQNMHGAQSQQWQGKPSRSGQRSTCPCSPFFPLFWVSASVMGWSPLHVVGLRMRNQNLDKRFSFWLGPWSLSLTNSVWCDGVDRKEVMPCQQVHILRCFKPQHGLQLYIPKRSFPMGIHDATRNGVSDVVGELTAIRWHQIPLLSPYFNTKAGLWRIIMNRTNTLNWSVVEPWPGETFLQYSIPTPCTSMYCIIMYHCMAVYHPFHDNGYPGSLAHMLWVSVNKVQAKRHQLIPIMLGTTEHTESCCEPVLVRMVGTKAWTENKQITSNCFWNNPPKRWFNIVKIQTTLSEQFQSTNKCH